MKRIYFLLILFLFSCNCKTEPDPQQLMDVDSAFSALAEKYGWKKAFIEYAHPDAILLRENRMPIVGEPEINELLGDTVNTGVNFSWKPLDAKISSSEDMGFTYGIYTIKVDSLKQQGTYVSIWVKDSEGNWKYILDSGNEGLGE